MESRLPDCFVTPTFMQAVPVSLPPFGAAAAARPGFVSGPVASVDNPKPTQEAPPKTTTPFQVKLVSGETFTAQLPHYPAHSHVHGSLASVGDVREAVEKATSIPTANQILLINGEKMVQSKEAEQIALLLKGDQCVSVVVKETPTFSACGVHAAYPKDCFCLTCCEIMCAKCGIRHEASARRSHHVVDMADETHFYDVAKESVSETYRSLEQLQSERNKKLSSSMATLNETLTLLEVRHRAVLEAELEVAEATMLEDRWESCEHPIDIATFLAAEYQRKKKLASTAMAAAPAVPGLLSASPFVTNLRGFPPAVAPADSWNSVPPRPW